jgi:hypothetical protein
MSGARERHEHGEDGDPHESTVADPVRNGLCAPD